MPISPTPPPQAYTREFLTSAFNWLQTQPESVRKLATSPDALVGLFRRAQRYGASSIESDAPISSQNFMSDLKNLAEGLKQFEGPNSAHRQPPGAAQNPNVDPVPSPVVAPTETSIAGAMNELSMAWLNERSRKMIQEVKTELNLSTDAETVNLMVSLAYKSLRSLLA